jgi:predicted Fe-Mo cluster-binding NifX family protein
MSDNKMFINDEQHISNDLIKEGNIMRIALPITQGKLSSHFGHCEQFALVDVDDKTKKIISSQLVDSPTHQPGLLPQWLQENGVNIVITGGMGSRAIALFEEKNITVVLGAKADTPERIVMEYLNGTLELSDNICDH